MANFIPPKELVAKILELNRLDFLSGDRHNMVARPYISHKKRPTQKHTKRDNDPREAGEPMFVNVKHATFMRLQGMHERNAYLDRVPPELFEQVFNENPTLFDFYANDFWNSNALWLKKGHDSDIVLPPAMLEAFIRMTGTRGIVDAQDTKGFDVMHAMDQIGEAVAKHMEKIHPTIAGTDVVVDFGILASGVYESIGRKELLWGKTFSGKLEENLAKVEKWTEAAVTEMLATNKPQDKKLDKGIIPTPMIKAAGNLLGIHELLSVEREDAEGFTLRGKTSVTNEEMAAIRSRQRTTFLEDARWWADHAVKVGTPAAMRSAANIKKHIESIAATTLVSDGETPLIDLVDMGKLKAAEERRITEKAETLKLEVERDIRAIRRGRRGDFSVAG